MFNSGWISIDDLNTAVRGVRVRREKMGVGMEKMNVGLGFLKKNVFKCFLGLLIFIK